MIGRSNLAGYRQNNACKAVSVHNKNSKSDMAHNCRKCKNHGILAPLKGHKPKCIFQDCDCSLCSITDRPNNLQKQFYKKDSEENNTAGQTIGSTRCMNIITSANRLYESEKEFKQKSTAEKKRGKSRYLEMILFSNYLVVLA